MNELCLIVILRYQCEFTNSSIHAI